MKKTAQRFWIKTLAVVCFLCSFVLVEQLVAGQLPIMAAVCLMPLSGLATVRLMRLCCRPARMRRVKRSAYVNGTARKPAGLRVHQRAAHSNATPAA